MTSSSPPIHVVVLAAGRGSRLGPLGEQLPKWLLDVGGRTLADRHLEGIARAGDAVASTRVVVGHAADAVREEMARRDAEVMVVDNPEYADINNWWSLLRALRGLPDGAGVAVINADLLAAPDAVAGFLRHAAHGPYDALLAVDVEQAVTDESMKVQVGPEGTLERIAKIGVDEPLGEYVGLLAARAEAVGHLRRRLESFVGAPEHVNEWYERAVALTVADGVAWHVWPMPTGGWVEIDDDDDLSAAEALVGAS